MKPPSQSRQASIRPAKKWHYLFQYENSGESPTEKTSYFLFAE